MDTARHLGANAFSRTWFRQRLLVLCYHGVIAEGRPDDPWFPMVDTVTLQEFREQLEILCRHFTPVAAIDVLDSVKDIRALPPRPVDVTFDDGQRNILTTAASEMNRFGVPALINVTTGYIGNVECSYLVYPNGKRRDYSPAVVTETSRIGYQLGLTLTGETNPSRLTPLEINRLWIGVGLHRNAFHAKISGLASLKLAVRR